LTLKLILLAFVLSLSKHERRIGATFDKLRVNGGMSFKYETLNNSAGILGLLSSLLPFLRKDPSGL